MGDRDRKNQMQCIVEEGVLLNRRDIVRVLRDLGQVRYTDFLEGVPKCTGEGIVASVVSNNSSSTVIANRRLYLNVGSFDCLRIGVEDDQPFFELVDPIRTIRLAPLADANSERPLPHAEQVFSKSQFGHLFTDSVMEVYLEEDEEDLG